MQKRIVTLLTAIIAGATPGMTGAGVHSDPCGLESDIDNDTVPWCVDNCPLVRNGFFEAPNNQCDTDGDGYGNACDFDINNDFVVGGPDFACFTANFGKTGHPLVACDSNCDGTVGGPDFGLFTATFGQSVGPSGLSCARTTPCP
jgi:hypothetical protein